MPHCGHGFARSLSYAWTNKAKHSGGKGDGRQLSCYRGAISTTIFALSTLPMLFKAFRTKDLSSYSLGNILLANVGNLVYSVYVFDLPAGPIWLLHSFYLVTTALMLFWYLRYEWRPRVWRLRVRRSGSEQAG
jgi:uncharacterized protein with PQ loop repeat